MNEAVDSYMWKDPAAYGPALADRLVACPCGSLKSRLVWIPLIFFLTDEAIRTRVGQYAARCPELEFRTEMETTLEESKKW